MNHSLDITPFTASRTLGCQIDGGGGPVSRFLLAVFSRFKPFFCVFRGLFIKNRLSPARLLDPPVYLAPQSRNLVVYEKVCDQCTKGFIILINTFYSK